MTIGAKQVSAPSDMGRGFPIAISLKTMFAAVAIGVGLWVLYHLLVVVLVAVLALFIVGTLGPAVEWLESHRMTRGWAIALVFVSLVSCMVLLMGLTIPSLVEQTTRLAKQEPMIRERVASLLSRSPLGAPLADSLRTARYRPLSKDATGAAMAYSGRAFEIVAYVVSGVFLALYTMIDRDRLRGGLFAVVPRSHHIRLSRVLLNLETIVGGYIRGQIITSGLMAVFVFALLTACRIPNAIALAVFAGIADVLPYIGTFLSVGPATLAALSRGPGITVIVLVAMLAYEELESRFLVPRVYGRALRLPSSMVLLALLAGGALLGIVGALLALPVAAAVRMLVEELRIELPGEQLDDTKLRERDDRAEAEYERRTQGVPAVQAAAIAVQISEERRGDEGTPEYATTGERA
jgi:predicted PurR-regulated permease PerM